MAIPRGACAQATRPPARGGRGREGGVRAPAPNAKLSPYRRPPSFIDVGNCPNLGQFVAGLIVPMSLHPPNHRPRAAAFGTDNCRSALMAGTAPPAPHLPFAIPAGTGSIGWVPALGTRGFHRPVSDPSTDLQVRCHGSGRDGRDVPIAVVSGLLNSKKLLRCTFGDNLERRPKCWMGVLRVGGIVHVRQHCASVPPYGLIGRTSSSAPFRFSSVDNRHADEASGLSSASRI